MVVATAPVALFAQSPDRNYIITQTYKTATATDNIANKVSGVVTKRFGNVADTKQLAREANQTASVSAKDPTSTGRAAKADATKSKLNKAEAVNSYSGQTASGVAGNGLQNMPNEIKSRIGQQSNQQRNKTNMPSDATSTKNN